MTDSQKNRCSLDGVQRKDINKQISANGNHGYGGLPLSKLICCDDLSACARNHTKSAYKEFAKENDEYNPRSKDTLFDKDEKRGEDQELIGNGIEELAEIGYLPTRPGEVSINLVSETQNHIDNKCRNYLEFVRDADKRERPQRKGHIYGNEQDANAGDNVRRGPDAIKFFML